jgi:folate-dependent phosphoribosylglycinamide formyltransferase PurN
MLKTLYQPRDIPMQVAVFMSRKGTNAIKLLEHERDRGRHGYTISCLVTDNSKKGNNSLEIADCFRLPQPIYSDFDLFRLEHITDPKNMAERKPYFRALMERISTVQPRIDCIALAGYELIVTEPLLGKFTGRIVNIHPSNLGLRNAEGKPLFPGSHAVRNAILAGESEIRASTHLVINGVDEGPVLVVSKPVKVVLSDGLTLEDLRRRENRSLATAIAGQHQDELKMVGDWIIYPLTLELMARGAFSRDERGTIYLRDEPIPNGATFEAAQKALEA